MRIIDISMPISPDMMVYKNRESMRPKLEDFRNYETADVYETRMTIHLHTGTHMDAPLHMVEGGAAIDKTDLNKTISRCRVYDLTSVSGGITREDLAGLGIKRDDFVLLKTRNSLSEDFDIDFVYVEQSGAEYLREAGIRGVGIDGLGIERSQPGHETHITLLGAGIPILEGLRLGHVGEGEYTLLAAPVSIRGVEGAPVRALLLDGDLSAL